MSLIGSIDLPEEFAVYTDGRGQRLSALEPTSTINIIVGSNNSGKSRFLRMLAGQTEYKVKLEDLNLNSIHNEIIHILNEIRLALEKYHIGEAHGLSPSNIPEILDLPDYLSLKTDNYRDLRVKLGKWSDFPEISSYTYTRGWNPQPRELLELRTIIREASAKALRVVDQIPVNSDATSPLRFYIPILRGLRPIDDQHSDLYAKRTLLDYYTSRGSVHESPPKVFTGLSLYENLTGMLLGNNTERKTISDYQEFISRTLYEGKPVTLIPSLQDKAVVVKIGNEAERPIYHLGDGIQSAIILSFLPYTTKQPSFFFIEEPEMYMHPGLQRKILNLFADLPHHRFFLTTHSNHFLDLTIDIKDVSVFTFRKQLAQDEDNDEQTPGFTVEAVDRGDSSSLELLGVRNSSVFLVNATVWVEGITDRWYLRKMLTVYMDHLRANGKLPLRLEEDMHYSFVEYGGGNITHFSFLEDEEQPIEVKRLCARAIVIIDGDGDKKLTRKDKLAQELGERLIIIPGWEIENLLPYKIIKEVVFDYEKDPDLKLPDIKYNSYQNQYLGNFIQTRMLKNNAKRRGGYKDKSGTIKSKVSFCERALLKIQQFEDLPVTTQKVIEKIYGFILDLNT